MSDDVLQLIARHVEKLLVPGGCLLLVNHYFFGFDSASKHTRRIHDVFRSGASLALVSEHWRPFFLATILSK